MLKKIAIILVVLLIAAFVSLYMQNSRAPELGVSGGKLKPLSDKPNAGSTQASDASKRVPTLPMKGSVAATREAILTAIDSYGGAEIISNEDDYIYVVFVTPLMKWRDDVEFWIDSESQQVHFRSSSRAGYSDRGLNKQRYEALAQAYNQ